MRSFGSGEGRMDEQPSGFLDRITKVLCSAGALGLNDEEERR